VDSGPNRSTFVKCSSKINSKALFICIIWVFKKSASKNWRVSNGIVFALFLEIRSQVPQKLISWSTPAKSGFLDNYLSSFINYILFISHDTISTFSYEQIKWAVDNSIEFLKLDYQILETGLQTYSPSVFRNQFFKAITKNSFFIKTQCIQTWHKSVWPLASGSTLPSSSS
jgi:hypothetical protein